MKQLQKAWMPWTAADQFPTEEAFGRWLERRAKVFGDIRMILLILASAALIVGYVLDRRPVMLLSILPLALMILLTLAITKTEEARNQTNKTQS